MGRWLPGAQAGQGHSPACRHNSYFIRANLLHSVARLLSLHQDLFYRVESNSSKTIICHSLPWYHCLFLQIWNVKRWKIYVHSDYFWKSFSGVLKRGLIFIFLNNFSEIFKCSSLAYLSIIIIFLSLCFFNSDLTLVCNEISFAIKCMNMSL